MGVTRFNDPRIADLLRLVDVYRNASAQDLIVSQEAADKISAALDAVCGWAEDVFQQLDRALSTARNENRNVNALATEVENLKLEKAGVQGSRDALEDEVHRLKAELLAEAGEVEAAAEAHASAWLVARLVSAAGYDRSTQAGLALSQALLDWRTHAVGDGPMEPVPGHVVAELARRRQVALDEVQRQVVEGFPELVVARRSRDGLVPWGGWTYDPDTGRPTVRLHDIEERRTFFAARDGISPPRVDVTPDPGLGHSVESP